MFQKLTPGVNQKSIDWNITNVPDGRYRVFAELIPGKFGGHSEKAFTTPRAARENSGNGTLTLQSVGVGTNKVKLSGPIGAYLNPTMFIGSNELVLGTITDDEDGNLYLSFVDGYGYVVEDNIPAWVAKLADFAAEGNPGGRSVHGTGDRFARAAAAHRGRHHHRTHNGLLRVRWGWPRHLRSV